MEQKFVYYGTKTDTKELSKFVKHVIESNVRSEEEGRRKMPICIWGRHGIGKTQIVEAFAAENGYQFEYIAPAQFEEMGDLVGMPHIDKDANGKTITTMAKPDWVPSEEGPGILLIDDVNRADDRILRGIMQLLQNYELVSWKLPAKWHIVLTANPDGGDYSVTPMDFAMLTRMMHITLTFDAKRWAMWAEANGVDPRVISFVLTYPEVVTGERTTPRTLVGFAESIASIEDLKADLGLVKMLADSSMDMAAVTSFISFIKNDLSKLISPEEIIGAKSFKDVETKIKGLVDKETVRVDILSVICTRLINYLLLNDTKITKKNIDNVIAFLKMDLLPNDLRLISLQDLVESNKASLKAIVKDKVLSKLYLTKA